jgi:hypothetical protein
MADKMIIWKHQLNNVGVETILDLRVSARVLHIAEQHGWICLWEAHQAEETRTERRTFELAGTGHPAKVDPARHVGTALVQGGTHVFHLFETTPGA